MERKSKELMFISMDQEKSNFKDKFFKNLLLVCMYVLYSYQVWEFKLILILILCRNKRM